MQKEFSFFFFLSENTVIEQNGNRKKGRKVKYVVKGDME